MSMAANKKKNAPRLDRNAWLDEALEVVARDGGARLRIDTLVHEMGVTKGSFYWHFKSRDEFVVTLLEHWHQRSTLVVPEQLANSTSTAEERLLELMVMILGDELTRYDLAIRSWAIQEPNIRPYVRRTDVFRLGFVRDLFLEMGFDDFAADVRARTLVTDAALQGAIFDPLAKSKRANYVKSLHAMLIQPV